MSSQQLSAALDRTRGPCRSAGEASKSKPRFAEFACSHTEVYRFVVLVTKAVVPKLFWGGDENFKQVMSALKNFISYRRYETMSLHGLCRDSAQPDASGPYLAMLPLPIFPRQIASSDVSSSKNSSFGISGHLWLRCCELLFMSQNPRHSRI
ncbi:hypothetical protein BGY98DRAFT_1075875, partial [Russula aff. rugulosa BPL654]